MIFILFYRLYFLFSYAMAAKNEPRANLRTNIQQRINTRDLFVKVSNQSHAMLVYFILIA